MKVIVEIAEDEVLVALRRVEGYEDVHPEILTDDAIGDRWPEWRTIHGDQVAPTNTGNKPRGEATSA